jgi:hypothetical protein
MISRKDVLSNLLEPVADPRPRSMKFSVVKFYLKTEIKKKRNRQ